ncbi:hypothetical protein BDQ17DRAFT_1437378 [Cyathus striatus]|nr:hypothetical protein BDQ17DRAFT_1437378 [Cyathus striatus]
MPSKNVKTSAEILSEFPVQHQPHLVALWSANSGIPSERSLKAWVAQRELDYTEVYKWIVRKRHEARTAKEVLSSWATHYELDINIGDPGQFSPLLRLQPTNLPHFSPTPGWTPAPTPAASTAINAMPAALAPAASTTIAVATATLVPVAVAATPTAPTSAPVTVPVTPATPGPAPIVVAATPATPGLAPIVVAATPAAPTSATVTVPVTPATPGPAPIVVAATPAAPTSATVTVPVTPATPGPAPIVVAATPAAPTSATVTVPVTPATPAPAPIVVPATPATPVSAIPAPVFTTPVAPGGVGGLSSQYVVLPALPLGWYYAPRRLPTSSSASQTPPAPSSQSDFTDIGGMWN